MIAHELLKPCRWRPNAFTGLPKNTNPTKDTNLSLLGAAMPLRHSYTWATRQHLLLRWPGGGQLLEITACPSTVYSDVTKMRYTGLQITTLPGAQSSTRTTERFAALADHPSASADTQRVFDRLTRKLSTSAPGTEQCGGQECAHDHCTPLLQHPVPLYQDAVHSVATSIEVTKRIGLDAHVQPLRQPPELEAQALRLHAQQTVDGDLQAFRQEVPLACSEVPGQHCKRTFHSMVLSMGACVCRLWRAPAANSHKQRGEIGRVLKSLVLRRCCAHVPPLLNYLPSQPAPM